MLFNWIKKIKLLLKLKLITRIKLRWFILCELDRLNDALILVGNLFLHLRIVKLIFSLTLWMSCELLTILGNLTKKVIGRLF